MPKQILSQKLKSLEDAIKRMQDSIDRLEAAAVQPQPAQKNQPAVELNPIDVVEDVRRDAALRAAMSGIIERDANIIESAKLRNYISGLGYDLTPRQRHYILLGQIWRLK